MLTALIILSEFGLFFSCDEDMRGTQFVKVFSVCQPLLKITYLYFRSNVAMLHVYYKEKTVMRYMTDIRFGVEDFICKDFESILKLTIFAFVFLDA